MIYHFTSNKWKKIKFKKYQVLAWAENNKNSHALLMRMKIGGTILEKYSGNKLYIPYDLGNPLSVQQEKMHNNVYSSFYRNGKRLVQLWNGFNGLGPGTLPTVPWKLPIVGKRTFCK